MPSRIVTKPSGKTVVRDSRTKEYTYGPGPWCGTSSGYGNHRCRCDKCKAWKAEANKRYLQTERGKEVRKAAWQKYEAEKRRTRQVEAFAAVKRINSIFYILDRVGTGEITAEEAVQTIIRKYG